MRREALDGSIIVLLVESLWFRRSTSGHHGQLSRVALRLIVRVDGTGRVNGRFGRLEGDGGDRKQAVIVGEGRMRSC
jgi:hypothetical protein